MGINVDWELLHKAEKQQESLQRRLKEALKEQDPAEYRRRFPEEFHGEQTVTTPVERILRPPELLLPIEVVHFPDMPRKNEGFTIVHAMIMVAVMLILVPLISLAFIIGAMMPGMLLLIVALIGVYAAAKLKNKVESP